MATTFKARAIAAELAAELRYRQSALAVVESFDSDENPLVRVGSGVAGEAGALIKVQPISWPLAKDVLGLAAEMYTPHIVKVNIEANPAGGAGADINTLGQILLYLGVAVTRGARTEVYTSAAGTAPNATDIDNDALRTGVFANNPQYPLMSGQ